MSTLKEPVAVISEYRRGACKVNYGEVTISASPAPSFSFKSEACWPVESYEGYVRQAILDASDSSGFGSDFGAKFVLIEVGWHDTDSSREGYYHAAKQAAEEFLRRAAPAALHAV